MVNATTYLQVQPALESVWTWLAQVPDPEMPVLSVVDLGIVREVRWAAGAGAHERADELIVVVTPTYSGCPATQTIADAIRDALLGQGIASVRVETRLSPPWTTDWMNAAARQKLADQGIAPPAPGVQPLHDLRHRPLTAKPPPSVACPHCRATTTRLVSSFGSTPCKALHFCSACRNPFEHFKCH